MTNLFRRIATHFTSAPRRLKTSKAAARSLAEVHGMNERNEVHIRVWLFREGDHFVAQGIDIDYVACGRTREQAERHFEEGFVATIEAHQEKFGHLTNFVKQPPQEIVTEFFKAIRASRNQTRTEERQIPGVANKSIDTPLLNSVQFVEACCA
jgi:hypothetical protein